MIQHRVERRAEQLKISIDLDLDEVFAALDDATLLARYETRIRDVFRRIERDVFEVAALVREEGEEGRVKFFLDDRGYGFITTYDSRDVFFHYSGIAGDDPYKTIKAGTKVRFKERQGRETREAIDIRPIED